MNDTGPAKGTFRTMLKRLASTRSNEVMAALRADVREFAERSVLVAVPPAQPRKLARALLYVATNSEEPHVQRAARESISALPSLFGPLLASAVADATKLSTGSGARPSGGLLLAACAIIESQCLINRHALADTNEVGTAKLPSWAADIVSAQAQLLGIVYEDGGVSHKSRGSRLLEACERALSRALRSAASHSVSDSCSISHQFL